MAEGVLIIGIGRGTKQLQQYLACSKTYETVVLFGVSTDTYDGTGVITDRADCEHITQELITERLKGFQGTIQQTPPLYSALKINGVKACVYARREEEPPRQLESRQMQVDECVLLNWYEAGQHDFTLPGETLTAAVPAARIRLTVCSGFYVRSFAHDLGVAAQSQAHMTSLLRTRQATFTARISQELPGCISALSYADLDDGEHVWGTKLRPQLEMWVNANPINNGHVNGRDQDTKAKLAADKAMRPRQRFRGEWVAAEKSERVKQQGGKFKGKWSRKPAVDAFGTQNHEETTKAD